MNALDRLIAALSPEHGERRLRARARMEAMQSARMSLFDAGRRSRRTHSWRFQGADANVAIGADGLRNLRAAARDAVRNTTYGKRLVDVIANNVVGAGIKPQLPAGYSGKDRLESLVRDHLETKAIDPEGRRNFYSIQRLVMRAVVRDGECLVRFRPRLPKDNLPLPFQLQVLESDYLDESKDGEVKDGGKVVGRIVQGVEFNAIGERVGYWLLPEHPGGARSTHLRSKRVPADEIAHVFDGDRPGQARGVTWLVAALTRIYDLVEFQDAQLMAQKVAALFSAVTTDVEGDVRNSADDLVPKALEPGTLISLPPGRDIKFSNPPSVEAGGGYTRDVVRAIATGTGTSYEAMSGDYGQVNFASGRMGHLEFNRSIQCWQQEVMIMQLCRTVEKWTMRAASLKGAPWRWVSPRRDAINPKEEILTDQLAIRAGLQTPTDAIRARGLDPDALFNQWRSDAKKIDEFNLTFDSDPRKVTQAGIEQKDGGDGHE